MAMSLLRRMFECLATVTGYRVKARLISLDLERSPIHRLPPELILLIGDHLSEVSAASLSLTCYTFYSWLGKNYLETLSKAGSLAKSSFLGILERDLPTHVICTHCNALHPFSLVRNYHPSHRLAFEARLACWGADWKNVLRGGIFQEFSSTIFRIAMKAHRQGHENSKLFLDLLSYETGYFVHWGFRGLRTATARIQDGTLLLREQAVYMVPSSQKIPIPWCCGVEVCSHIQACTMRSLRRYGIQIPSAEEIEGYENEQGIIGCNYCHTEFRIDFKSYGKAGNAMFVTKWMDIGQGRDANDPKFTRRFRCVKPKTSDRIEFQRGSICAAFEQRCHTLFRFDSLLTRRDENYLCSRNPWPWPDNIKIPDREVKQFYTVRDGKFIRIED